MDLPFDPYTQDVIFHFADGTPFPVSIVELNYFVQYNTRISINYGAQLGASIIVLFLVALLTAPEKRRTAVFALNVVALFCGVVRMLCMSIYFTTEFSEAYSYFAGDFSRVPASAYASSVLGVCMTTCLLICVEFSLLIQTHAICSTLRDVHRRVILAFSLIVVLVTIGFRIGLNVENCKVIVKATSFSPFVWLQSANNIIITASIFYFSAIFVTKLGYAIYSRKKLGLTGFGAMQVIFIMSCQTMIIPAAFALMQYWVDIPELNQNVYTLMAISLPLTSIWATTAVNHSHQASLAAPSSQRRRLWAGSLGDGSHNSSLHKPRVPGPFEHGMSNHSTLVPSKSLSTEQLDRMYPDLERGNGNGVHSNCDWSVDSGKFRGSGNRRYSPRKVIEISGDLQKS